MLLESLLAETFGVPVSDPRVQGVVKEMDRCKGLDHDALKREQIRRDKSTDYKLLSDRYHCSSQTVYRAWSEILPALETK